MERLNNNVVFVTGTIVENPVFSHVVFGESFLAFPLKVNRASQESDVLLVVISERIIDVRMDYIGKRVKITGQFRSYNAFIDGKNRLKLNVFARDISFDAPESDENNIFLNGYVCRPVTYRKTPLGREIADVLLAVNRPYGKSDYIPCILWGRNARFSESFEVGDRIKVWGRIQSREYQKKISETEFEKRVAYEVSVGKVEIAKECF